MSFNSTSAIKKCRVLVDMDGVCANLDQHLVNIMRERKIDGWQTIENRKEFEYNDIVDKSAKLIMAEKGFYQGLPIMEGCVTALQDMQKSDLFDIFFCTSPLKQYHYCVTEKYAFVEKHFGADWTRKIIITKDKTVVAADYLIDDKPEQTGVDSCPTWKHVLFDQSYNRHLVNKPRLCAWSEWKTVLVKPAQV